jgi:hypothetical protein
VASNPVAREVLARAAAAGWRVRQGGKHLVLYPPRGRPIIVPRGKMFPRGERNLLAAVKRHGLD